MISLLDRLSRPECWESFYRYKTERNCSRETQKQLRAWIDRAGWMPVCANIRDGVPFPLPRRSVVSKLSTQKKRVVYTYPQDENTVLKLLTHLLLRKYDRLFCPELYSFRPARTAKDAIRRLHYLHTERLFSYKVDISNYFNSVPVDLLLADLETVTADDPALFGFLRALLTEPCALENGRPVTESKGIMAGTPLSAFYANLFLRELDAYFHERRIPYARYSDDIIVFGETPEQTAEYAGIIRQFLADRRLKVNPAKECFQSPAEGWCFLGFSVCGDAVDIAPASVRKLKHKMRRKTRALHRWAKRSQIPGEKAAAAFIRIFNRKLFERPEDQDHMLSWSLWYFPVITTDAGLREIDRYAQDCLRFLISGRRTKARFNVRYEDLKRLGYRSLVHAYYAPSPEKPPAAE